MLALERVRVRLGFTDGGSRGEEKTEDYGKKESSQEKIRQEERKEGGYSRVRLH
jgi:hypothetical protein